MSQGVLTPASSHLGDDNSHPVLSSSLPLDILGDHNDYLVRDNQWCRAAFVNSSSGTPWRMTADRYAGPRFEGIGRDKAQGAGKVSGDRPLSCGALLGPALRPPRRHTGRASPSTAISVTCTSPPSVP